MREKMSGIEGLWRVSPLAGTSLKSIIIDQLHFVEYRNCEYFLFTKALAVVVECELSCSAPLDVLKLAVESRLEWFLGRVLFFKTYTHTSRS